MKKECREGNQPECRASGFLQIVLGARQVPPMVHQAADLLYYISHSTVKCQASFASELYLKSVRSLSIPSPRPAFLRTANVSTALSWYSRPSSAPRTTAGCTDEIQRSPLKCITSVCGTRIMRSFNCFVYHLNADFIFSVFAPLQGFWCELKHENRVL